jgi:excinuclease ABC subunit C
MVRLIDRVEVVSCHSEHEAAWLERNLLERQIPRWNVTAGGQEVAVCVRLDGSATAPGLSVVHTAGGLTADGARPHAVWYFGPYLGGAKVRTAVAGLHRVFPLGYAADNQAGAAREMARQRGVNGCDRAELAQSLAAVLDRDPAAVADIRAQLASRRDAASQAQAYELAGRIQAELAALDWITCPQRAASLICEDADVAGWADGLLVRFEITGGRIRGWRQCAMTSAQARPWLAVTPAAWQDFADRNALLAARLAGARLGLMS